jgi:hypothetical protein
MNRKSSQTTSLSSTISDSEIISIVDKKLPHWKLACDNAGADTVILQQVAFGRSLDEMFLMHIAIRYAGIAGKTVMIAPYPGSEGSSR